MITFISTENSHIQPYRSPIKRERQTIAQPTNTIQQPQRSPKERKRQTITQPIEQVRRTQRPIQQTSKSQPPKSIQTQKPKRASKLALDKRPQNRTRTTQTQNLTQTKNRSNLQSAVIFVKQLELKDHHLNMLKQTPFWLLIHAIRNGTLDPEKCPARTNEVVAKLIAAYNPSNDNFRLDRHNVNLATSEVKLIFGLTGGTRPFEVKLKKKEEVLFAKRNNITKRTLTSKAIGEMLQRYVQDDDTVKIEDTVRLVYMYLIVKLFFPTSGISISWKHVHVLEEINQIKTYDWALEIRNELMNSIKKNQHSPKEVKGCILLLLVSFLAVFNFLDMNTVFILFVYFCMWIVLFGHINCNVF